MKPLDRILLAHGGGGTLSRTLIRELFLPAFDNPTLATLSDAAVLSLPPGRLAFTTDSYVITPRFFPGGDIGTLAIAGTVNDLAVCGARPRFLSCSLILEEGLPLDDLRRVVGSMARTAADAGVQVVTGDTKVVERGGADGIFITTAGVGELRLLPDGWGTPLPGDQVLVNGPLGDHGFAVLAAREGLMFDNPLLSDCAPLNSLIDTLFDLGLRVRFMRDATRGGLAAVLNELAAGHDWGVALRADAIPVSPAARSLSEILGIDPLFVANEGKVVAVVAAGDASAALQSMRAHPLGREAAIIGTIEPGLRGLVTMDTDVGGRRILDMPLGEQLPPDLLMHEMGLACSVVTEIERVLSDFGPRARAVSVTLQVGRLRAVVPEAMTFCFEAASLGTRADGAVLLIEQVPVRVRCAHCDHEWEAEALEFFCSECEQPVQVLSGKELMLRTIEVDDAEE